MNETTNSRLSSLDAPIVSVIIPIYNAEKTLRRTVDSILKQTFHDFELILVNDGSNNGSLSICYLYASKDVRIKVVNHKNMGLSLARSSGIKASLGHYILFVDADDWIEPDTLEALYGEAKKTDADMVICDYFEHLDNAVKEVKQRPNYCSADNVLVSRSACSIWVKCLQKYTRVKLQVIKCILRDNSKLAHFIALSLV